MSDFEDKLNAILSNPDAMSQVMHLAQSLNLSAPGGESNSEPAPPPPVESNPMAGLGSNPMAGLGSLLGGIDPSMIQKLLPLLGELQSDQNDQRLQLLHALRPFLKPERQDKVEQALRAAKMIHMGKKLLTTMGDLHV